MQGMERGGGVLGRVHSAGDEVLDLEAGVCCGERHRTIELLPRPGQRTLRVGPRLDVGQYEAANARFGGNLTGALSGEVDSAHLVPALPPDRLIPSAVVRPHTASRE